MRSCLLMKSAARPVHCKVHMMLTILYIRIRSITVTILSCPRVSTLLRPSIKYGIFCQNMQKASTAMPALRATTRSTLLWFSQNMHCRLSNSCNKICQNAFVGSWVVNKPLAKSTISAILTVCALFGASVQYGKNWRIIMTLLELRNSTISSGIIIL